MPFSRGLFIMGNPVWVPEDSDELIIEKKRIELEVELNIITAKGDRYWDQPEADR